MIDSNDDTDVQSLTSTSYYVAGFTDASVENRLELYDIFANSKFVSPSCIPKTTLEFLKVTECIGDKYTQSSLIVSDGEVSIAPHAKGRSEGSIEYTPPPPPTE